MKQATQQPHHFSRLLALLLFSTIGISVAQATAVPQLSIKSAAYNKKTASLVVKTSAKNASGLVSLIHSKGGVLGQTSDSEHTFSIPMAQVGDIPCQVEARLGEMKISKAVSGASAECSKVPTCKILPFAKNTRPLFNVPFTFEAQVAIKDKKAAPLTVEWDFAGGVLGHPYERLLKDGKAILSGKIKTEATFVRDNSRYHVRFAAMDTLGRRCESGIYVTIGTPPASQPDSRPLALDAQHSQPPRAGGLTGDKVVMPFEDRSMQNLTDAWAYADTGLNYPIPANTINAYVYQKGLRPAPLGANNVELTYSAASNPADPVGPHSINSTSQNWPLNSPAKQATLLKGELFERYQRPADAVLSANYIHWSLVDRLLSNGAADHVLAPDEGGYNLSLSPSFSIDHGSYMPGITSPYVINEAQPFTAFIPKDSWFSANWLPLTDIDDSGRVNPTSLFRVQAKEAGTQTPLVATDTVVTTSRDFHCRECHAKGKIAANAGVSRTVRDPTMPLMLMPAADDSIQEQEYAAMQNATMLHAFYDDPMMIGKRVMAGMTGGAIYSDGPMSCGGGAAMCHSEPTADNLYQGKIGREATRGGRGSLSNAMHRMHGNLQYNADKSDIQRDSNGRYRCWDNYAKTDCAVDPSKSLFPVKDVNGKILPMEENCLKCHSGHREQTYRDRMFTAGVTCYQCHGDMLAVAELYEKSHTNPDGNPYRLEWLEQPDCGSCHTGSGNVGKDASKGYFSAGVKNLAFDENDPSATSAKVDLSNPDQSRFAVMPLTALPQNTAGYNPILQTPLFRMGKDDHGQVACAACHGAAHSVWPNRDPNANDNVASLQLQGHTGSVLECNVCHTPDSFAKFEDIDEGLKVADPKDGVLGGPHNLHPINDPYWWKSANGDKPNTDGTVSGGWHNNYAKLPGKVGEDQCAACHGNDHLGTRLSKTPVDRTFDFTDLPDQIALKKAGIKTKVTVKAGTPIGCNTCHSVTLSCTHSPNLDCGKPSEHVTGSSNQPPVMTPPYVIDAKIDEDLSYTLTATDPEGDTPTFQLAGSAPQIVVDSNGNLTVLGSSIASWAKDLTFAQQSANHFIRPPFNHDFKVVVSDNHGAFSVQPLTIRFDCPTGLAWDVLAMQCQAIAFADIPPYFGMNGVPNWSYQVQAISATGSTLSYALASPVPSGMSINGQGKISWDSSKVSGDFIATVKVTDQAHNEVDMDIYFTICQSPMRWSNDLFSCVGSVHITSTPPAGTSANSFSYQVKAGNDNPLPISYSLIGAPSGFSVSETGLISGDPSVVAIGEQRDLVFKVQAAESSNNWARQDVQLNVCPGNMPIFDPVKNTCLSGPISFTSTPDEWMSARQAYSYQASVTDDNANAAIKYALTGAPAGMSIDGNGLVSWDITGNEGKPIAYGVVARDSTGGFAIQPVHINICPYGKPTYDSATGLCTGPLNITSSQPTYGLDVGQTFSYQVTASNNNPNGLPINYSLKDDATIPGVTIDHTTGLITWVAEDMTNYGGFMYFTTTASDKLGFQDEQQVSITVCVAPDHWDAVNGYCTH